MIVLPNNFGRVLSASQNHIELDCGMLTIGDRVKLPPVTGGKLGNVESIEMILVEKGAELVLRIVDDDGQGHQFRYTEEELRKMTLQ